MTKTVLITGATGLLGRQVVIAFERAGWNTVGTGFSRAHPPAILKLDLCDASAVEAVIDKVKPQVLVHCAAARFPDDVERNPSFARALNITATSTLASLCTARSIFLLYISTDYVFPGTPGHAPYSTSATPAPSNLYGQTKLDGEKALLETCPAGLGVVLRIPVLYGSVERNAESSINSLVDVVWKAQEEGAKISMDDWAIRSPTNTEDVGRVCADVAARYTRVGAGELPRVLQFSSEDRITKYEICEKLADMLGLGLKGMVANKEGNDPKAATQRPYDCQLSTKALQEIGVDVYTQDFVGWWRRELRAVRR